MDKKMLGSLISKERNRKEISLQRYLKKIIIGEAYAIDTWRNVIPFSIGTRC